MRRRAEIVTLVVMIALVALYCYDAVRASTDILNLVFVLPVAILTLSLCIAQLSKAYRYNVEPDQPDDRALDRLPVILLFAAYVVSLPWAGFDAGTAVFVFSFLWIHEERRWLPLLGYSAGFAVVVSFFFSKMLPYPLPLLFLWKNG